MANIQKRGEYQYQADIRRKGFPRQTQTFLTKDDAERWVRKHEGQMDEGKFRDLRPVAKLTLGDALDRYMEEVVPTKAVGGQRNERNRIRLLKKHPLAKRELSTLQSSDFAKYRNERTAQVGSANTVRLELALLSHLYTIGQRMLSNQSRAEARAARAVDGNSNMAAECWATDRRSIRSPMKSLRVPRFVPKERQAHREERKSAFGGVARARLAQCQSC